MSAECDIEAYIASLGPNNIRPGDIHAFVAKCTGVGGSLHELPDKQQTWGNVVDEVEE
jgi:hypothetical protein